MTDSKNHRIDESPSGSVKYTDTAEHPGIPVATGSSYRSKKQSAPKRSKPATPEHKSSPPSIDIGEKTYVDYLGELGSKIAAGSAVESIRLLSAKEASKILGVNANTVYNLWSKGLLDYWRIHRTMKTNVQAISEFLKRTKNKDLSEVNEA